jgi:hypothetical protein
MLTTISGDADGSTWRFFVSREACKAARNVLLCR